MLGFIVKMKLITFNTVILVNIFSGALLAGKYRAKFKDVCGKIPEIQENRRIVGGKNADAGEFPWMARIGLKFENNHHPIFICGGSLITDYHILTAEHCFYPLIAQGQLHLVVVGLGNYRETGHRNCIGQCYEYAQIFRIKQLYAYKFRGWLKKDDIAVVQLAKRVEFTKFISPICLPDEIAPTKLVGESAITIGFGVTNSYTGKQSKILQKVTIKIRSSSACHMYNTSLGPGQLCAGGRDKGSCIGDSGGPLFKSISLNSEPRFMQLGLVSFGAKNCESSWPSVYTDIHYYLPWIDGHLNNARLS